MKRICCIFLAVVLTLCAFCSGGFLSVFAGISFSYTTTNGGAEIVIVGCDKAGSGSLVLPEEIGGLPVTQIGDDAFSGCAELTDIVLPDTVDNIGANAFEGCSSLKGMVLPQGVTRIESGTFYGCEALGKVTLCGLVTYFGDRSFYNCAALPDIAVVSPTAQFGSDVFTGCTQLRLHCFKDSDAARYAADNGISYDSDLSSGAPQLNNDSLFYINTSSKLLLSYEEGLTALCVRSQFMASGISVYKNGAKLSDSALCGTGCTVRRSVGGVEIDELTVVVMGDVDGSGKVTATDAKKALSAAADIILIVKNSPQWYAASVTGTAGIGADDARYILRVASGLSSLGTGVSAYEREVVRLVNQERADAGLPALSLNRKLCEIARMKSQDMHDKSYFSHTSPTYGTPFEMLESFGVAYSYAGENLARGQLTPEEVVAAWMASTGHRDNILSANYTKIGVGYVADGSYWTQEFIG